MSTGITLPTEKGDSWSFGSLCFEVFAGEDPYNLNLDLYVPILLSQGVTPEHPGSKAVGLSPNMWELMQSCWKIDPMGRASIHAIRTTIHEMCPPYDCVWFFVSLGRMLTLIWTLSSPAFFRQFGALRPDSRPSDKWHYSTSSRSELPVSQEFVSARTEEVSRGNWDPTVCHPGAQSFSTHSPHQNRWPSNGSTTSDWVLQESKRCLFIDIRTSPTSL
jgi:hypothetical protein